MTSSLAKREWSPPKPSFDSPKPNHGQRSAFANAWFQSSEHASIDFAERRLPTKSKRLPPKAKPVPMIDPILQNVYLEELALDQDQEVDSLERMWNWTFHQTRTADLTKNAPYVADRQQLSPFSTPSRLTPTPGAGRPTFVQHKHSSSQESDATSCHSCFESWEGGANDAHRHQATPIGNMSVSKLAKQWPRIIGKRSGSNTKRLFKPLNGAEQSSDRSGEVDGAANLASSFQDGTAEVNSQSPSRRQGAYYNTLRLPQAAGLGLRGASGPPKEDEGEMKEALLSFVATEGLACPQINVGSCSRVSTPQQQVILPFDANRRPRAPFPTVPSSRPTTITDTPSLPSLPLQQPKNLVRPIPLKAAKLLGAAPKDMPLATNRVVDEMLPPPSVLQPAPPTSVNVLSPCPDRMHGLNALVRPKPVRMAKLNSDDAPPSRPPRRSNDDLFEDVRSSVPSFAAVESFTPFGWTSEKADADRATLDSPYFSAKLIDANFREEVVNVADDEEEDAYLDSDITLDVGGMTFTTSRSTLCGNQDGQKVKHGGIQAWLNAVYTDLIHVEHATQTSARSPSLISCNSQDEFDPCQPPNRNTVNSFDDVITRGNPIDRFASPIGSLNGGEIGKPNGSTSSSTSSVNDSPPLASPTEQTYDFRIACLRDAGHLSAKSTIDVNDANTYDHATHNLWLDLRQSNKQLQRICDDEAAAAASATTTTAPTKKLHPALRSLHVLLPHDRNPLFYPAIIFALEKGTLPSYFARSNARTLLEGLRQECLWLGYHDLVLMCDRFNVTI